MAAPGDDLDFTQEAPPQRSVIPLLDWNGNHTGGEKMEET